MEVLDNVRKISFFQRSINDESMKQTTVPKFKFKWAPRNSLYNLAEMQESLISTITQACLTHKIKIECSWHIADQKKKERRQVIKATRFGNSNVCVYHCPYIFKISSCIKITNKSWEWVGNQVFITIIRDILPFLQ